MTEAEWLDSRYPIGLLNYLAKQSGFSDRKARLVAVACCRRIAEWLSDIFLPDVIDQCERCADDPEGGVHLLALGQTVRRYADRLQVQSAELELLDFVEAVESLTEWPIYPTYCVDRCRDAVCGYDDFTAGHGESLFQIDLIHDIFGNPFRPMTFDPSWRTSTAVSLARQMYESREFGAMPILADALQDAGCESADVLDHCRDSHGVHVRGCWVVDLVLGRP